MLIDKDSVVLYDTTVEEHQTQVTIFLRPDDGLCVRLFTKGIEFFKELETLTAEDDLHKGIYPTIDTLPNQVTQALKEFSGVDYYFTDIKTVILYHLLFTMKCLISQEQFN